MRPRVRDAEPRPASWAEVARLVLAWGEAKIAQLQAPETPERIRKLDEFDDRRIAYENRDFYLAADAGKAKDLMEAAIIEYLVTMGRIKPSETTRLFVGVRRRHPGGGESEYADKARAQRKPPPCVKPKGRKR